MWPAQSLVALAESLLAGGAKPTMSAGASTAIHMLFFHAGKNRARQYLVKSRAALSPRPARVIATSIITPFGGMATQRSLRISLQAHGDAITRVT